MTERFRSHWQSLFLWASFMLVSFSVAAQAQQNAQTPDTSQDTFRISTSLVQTDVSVFDKQGNFIDGLTRESFELKVDGKPLPVSLFQRLTAGSAEEAANLAAARGQWKPGTILPNNPLAQGQSVIFFVDDYHLEAAHIERAQKIIYSYLDKNLRAGDRMMIASSSGQLGFLQQFSDDATILRMAAAKLKYLPAATPDSERPRMSLFEAIAVSRNQPDVYEYLVQQYRAEELYRKVPLPNIRQMIRIRANNIVQFSRTINTAMFSTAEALLRGTTAVPGRKLLFFISSGIILDTNSDNSLADKVNRLVDWAARSGVVFYTVDARGLQSPLPDISDSISIAQSPTESTSPADAISIAFTETSLTQQSLRTLAYDTGGQPILNSNNLETRVSQAVREYQNYYVLAWEPEAFEKDKPKFRKIEVSVKGRPELVVRVRRGFFEAPPPPEKNEKKEDKKNDTKAAPTPVDPLTAAAREIYPRRDLPLSMYATFINDAGGGSSITVSAELPSDAVAEVGGSGEVDILCVIIDANGKAVKNDGRKLSFNRPGSAAPMLSTSFRLPITPGTYQVRTVARDVRSGRAGAEFQWLDIPKFQTDQLALSTILLSEQKNSDATATFSVSRRLARSSKLFFEVYLYNAALSANTKRPDLTMEIQVLRQTQPVLDAPAHPVEIKDDTDLTRISYSAAVPLARMTPGLYTLQLKATDRVKKATVTQRVNFAVE